MDGVASSESAFPQTRPDRDEPLHTPLSAYVGDRSTSEKGFSLDSSVWAQSKHRALKSDQGPRLEELSFRVLWTVGLF